MYGQLGLNTKQKTLKKYNISKLNKQQYDPEEKKVYNT